MPSRYASTILSTEPWTFGANSGQTLHTAHYRLFTTLPPSLLSERLPAFLETALSDYRSRYASLPGPESALDIYIVASRTQWTRLTARLLGDQAAAFQTIPRGGLTTGGRAILFDIGTQDTLALAAHEGWHQFTQRTFAVPLPAWAEEGLATAFEGFVWNPADPGRPAFQPWANLQRFDQLRAAAAGDRLLPLVSLLARDPAALAAQDPGSAIDYYAQVWALILFLREAEGRRYAPGLNALIADGAAGGPASQDRLADPRRAFEVYITPDLARVEIEFQRFVRQIVRTGAKDHVTIGRSPVP